jgi:competence protein ComGC
MKIWKLSPFENWYEFALTMMTMMMMMIIIIIIIIIIIVVFAKEEPYITRTDC